MKPDDALAAIADQAERALEVLHQEEPRRADQIEAWEHVREIAAEGLAEASFRLPLLEV